MSGQGQQGGTGNTGGASFTERVEMAGDQVVEAVTKLFKDGSVRKITLRDRRGRQLFSIPIAAGAAVGGLGLVFAPTLTAIGAVVALMTKVTVEIERTDVVPGGATVVDGEASSAGTPGQSEGASAPSGTEHPEGSNGSAWSSQL